MTDFLIRLGTLSLGGGVAVLLLLFTGRVSQKRYSARWRCRAWGILCLLMVLPIPLFCFPAPIQAPSALIHLDIPSDNAVLERPFWEFGEKTSVLPADSGQTVGDATHSTATLPNQVSQTPADPIRPAVSLPTLLLGLWLTGMAVLLTYHGISHLRFCCWVRRWAVPATDPDTLQVFHCAGDRLGLRRLPALLRCPRLSSPMLCGLTRPLLLLPEQSPAGEALELTLEHELTHFRHRDVWRKALALLANTIHWFNPLMWWMVRRMAYDLELACDDTVLQTHGQAGRAVYGRTVLEALEALSTRP